MHKPHKHIEKYAPHYSESGLWSKLKSIAKTVGSKTIYSALLLYYTLMDYNVPLADKAKITGALGYFILPVDIVADIVPLIGYTDDLIAMMTVIKMVGKNITPEIKAQAKNKVAEWFKEDDLSSLDTNQED